jgi:Predicted transcriptional regulators
MIETTENLEFDGTKIRQARGARSMTEVAEAVGISRQALMQIEKGDTKPSADTLVKLCAVLNIQISDLTKNF